MPRWDFRCPHCGVQETRVFINIEQADSTPVWCDKDACLCRMERQPSAPSLSFKGPGWTPKHYGGK